MKLVGNDWMPRGKLGHWSCFSTVEFTCGLGERLEDCSDGHKLQCLKTFLKLIVFKKKKKRHLVPFCFARVDTWFFHLLAA